MDEIEQLKRALEKANGLLEGSRQMTRKIDAALGDVDAHISRLEHGVITAYPGGGVTLPVSLTREQGAELKALFIEHRRLVQEHPEASRYANHLLKIERGLADLPK